ncbi:K(+)-transporting ATPase subunit C [Ferruginibacter albus]|uniref:K(+)-transporting ATPase subunit C n=1 Tax=Ferruginibacter albus TaxID=2875540 RepID=UPI001CC57CE8|nr:K(+)-transporting ATPase subunit C [Ferruginibacter albus]UAY52329.1 K(+)-transporting ATPase subunit C [Ferruginibacter albus]
MKKYLLPSLMLTLVFIVICSVLYPLLIAGIAKFAPGAGKGETVTVNGKVVGYANVGQKFTEDNFFWGRPSAVGYNAAGSAGSNKGPTNADYLATVQANIDTFLVHNPTVKKEDIPSDLVTNSGSGLDPDISPEAAYVQVDRIVSTRKIPKEKIITLIQSTTAKPLFNSLGPARVNVLKLNVGLAELK